MAVLFPKNFDLSEAAQARLRSLMEDGAEHRQTTVEDIVLALMWVDAELNNCEIDSQVGIGLFQRDELQPEDIALFDGIELTVAMPDESLAHFDNKRLDLIEGRLMLVHRIVS